MNFNSNEFSTTDDDDDARWTGRDDITNGDRTSRRVSAFMASKPRAYANEVRLRRDDATRAPSGAGRRARERARGDDASKSDDAMMVTDEMGSRSLAMKMFDAHAKANAQFGSAWRQPATTYAALAAAQTKASAERRRRDPSEESDVTRQDGGGAATTPYARNVIVDDDDEGPPPEAGVTCACCRAQKTPLWRNGPTGAKTLCNACGVRYKAGRVVCDENGKVVTLAPQGRKRAASATTGDAPYASLHKRVKTPQSSFGYAHLRDARLIELERVDKTTVSEKSPLARVHSATILTDYDGAVLLMLLHDGDDD
tara:strand:+ start:768 stop:1703 length:936 start_codon:yes stop_codon:yes gene_type:complete